MDEIIKELVEIKKLLQTIASSLEHKPVKLKIDGNEIGYALTSLENHD